MCDTQADICVIKKSSVKNLDYLDTSDIISIKGISNDTVDSLGTVIITILFDETSIKHTFHVVPDDFNIPSDGIIGKDFNKLYSCKIDYGDMSFTIRNNEYEISVPINSEPKQNTISLPPRVECYRIFHLKSYSEPSVILNQEISPGVFIPTTIVADKNPVLKVLNTNSELKSISNKIPKVYKLSDFNIFVAQHATNPSELITESRLKELNQLFAKNVPDYVRSELIQLCSQFADVFALPNDKMTVNNFYVQKFRTRDDDPVYVKNYRLPKTQKDEIDTQVKKLLDNDLIEPSISQFNSPLILVPKKSLNGVKKWRMCVDYRLLNKKLIPDKYPLPRIDDILDSLGKAKFFSVLDLYSGFHQIPLDEAAREMTAFSTDKGSFQWKVLPFGINVAPNSFSRMMALAFAGLPPQQAFIYMDDIIVIGGSINHHLHNLQKVFEVCRKYNLKLNPEKCEFFRHEVTFLGHNCSEKGIKPDNKKLDAIDKYPRPHDKDAARRFTAFANYYRRFIKNFAGIVAPLNRLTRKSVEFEWTDECEKAFNTLKECLKSPPILSYPSFDHDFLVTVDASIRHCGGVLSQTHTGHDLPISFISKSFQKGELNKPLIEKELLAIHFAITTFRPYLYGKRFTVRSDHRPLVYLYNLKDPASKLTRIRLDLEEYDFIVEYIKGKDNVVADALSRISIDELKENFNAVSILAMTRSMMRKITSPEKPIGSKCPKETNILKSPKIIIETSRQFIKNISRIRCTLINESQLNIRAHLKHRKVFEFSLTGNVANENLTVEMLLASLENEAKRANLNELQWPFEDDIFKIISMQKFIEIGDKILDNLIIHIIPCVKCISDESETHDIISRYHDDPLFGGHAGQNRLYAKIRSLFYWKGMKRDIAKFVQNCTNCNVNKPRNKVKVPLCITSTPQKPFDIVIVDTIGKLPKSNNGNFYAITVLCDLTKYLIAIPIPNKEANTVAKALFENVILVYGLFSEIRTDCGTEYKNQILDCLWKLLDVSSKFSTPYRHQTVGTAERSHRTFNEYIRAYVQNMENWEEYLKYFTFSYNITPNTCFNYKFSPYELVFCKEPNSPFNLSDKKIDPIYNIDNFAYVAKYKLQKAHKAAIELLESAKFRNKKYYDNYVTNFDLQINDDVYVENQPYDKFKNVYSGPFKVISIDHPNVEIFDKELQKTKKVHMNRLRK